MTITIQKKSSYEKIKYLNHIAWFAAFPLFGLYSFIPNNPITWGHALLIITFVLDILNTKSSTKIDLRFLPLMAYTVLQTLGIYLLTDLQEISLAIKAGQWLLYIALIMLFGKQYFDREIACNVLKTVGVFCAVFLIVQQIVASVAGIYLAPGIPAFPYAREELKSAYEGLYHWGGTYRPRSTFSEPAAFCQYELLALAVCMFGKGEMKNRKISCLLMGLGILISKSTTGFICLAFLCAVGIYQLLKTKPQHRRTIILLGIILLPLGLWFLLNDPNIQFQLGRMAKNGLRGETRFQIFQSIEALDMHTIRTLLFGHGFSSDFFESETLYMAGFLRHFFCFGLIGIIVLVQLFVSLWRRGSCCQHIVLVLFFIMNIGANPLHSGDILQFIAILALDQDRENTEKERKNESTGSYR